jgi:hypothetical protein
MGKDLSTGAMDLVIMVTISTAKNMEMAPLTTILEGTTKDSGSMESRVELALSMKKLGY